MPTGSVAIYVIGRGMNEDSLIRLGVSRLSAAFDRVAVVTEPEFASRFDGLFEGLPNVAIQSFDGRILTPLAGWRQVLLELFRSEETEAPVLLTGSHVFGPIGTLGPGGFELPQGASVMAPFWHNCALDVRMSPFKAPDRVPQLDFTLFSSALLADPAFQAFWRDLTPVNDAWRDLLDGTVGLGRMLEAGGHVVAYPMAEGSVGSAEPRFFEIDRVVRAGSPCLPVSVLLLDPLIHDVSAINLRGALDWLRATDPEIYRAIIRFATRHVKLRDFCTIADQYEVISPRAERAEVQHWSFGTIAVFIHAYYAEMMPEFWELIARLPKDSHLFITTASPDNADAIRAFLDAKGWPEEGADVRVVEENRGRDMSSLFITWRDVALSGKYEVSLRLHSKRTPQVSRQVGESFKDHLFDNLVHSEGYVRNILDMFEREPDIGMVVPPVVHVGFGTLGHSWYNNKRTLADLAAEMYIDVPLDDDTPVAPYGTMYWFRTDALLKMFDWRWKWSDYNAEPHHIDGGVAHVQERLIGYAVQDRGYRVIQVMTPQMAARNYARLEYKAQMFASYCASNNVIDQKLELESRGMALRRSIYRNLRHAYGRTLQRFPKSRGLLRPFKTAAVFFLARGD